MSMRFFGAAVLAALVGSSFTSSVSLAKPPDLPVDLRILCEEAQEVALEGEFSIEIGLGNISVRFQNDPPARSENCPCLDSCCPALIQRLCQEWFFGSDTAARQTKADQRAHKVRARCGNAAVVRTGPATRESNTCHEFAADRTPDGNRLAQAREMFQIAERCRQTGDFDKARTCYQEAHLLSPESRYGRQAIQRLAEIDAARVNQEATSGGDEEQEPPLYVPQQRDNREESRRENMLRETQPLGLVPWQLISTPR